MNFKRILSSALVVVLLFGSIIGVMPIKTRAAYISSSDTNLLGKEEIWAYAESVCGYNYSSVEEMLNDELQNGYLVSVNFNNSANSRYTLYVNKYSGFAYYVDNLTGQILSSNPYSYPKMAGGIISTLNADMTSQIVIYYSETTKTTVSQLYSSLDAARNAQISVEYISNGLRVNYTLGDTVARYLLPGFMTAENFENEILVPMLEEFCTLMYTHCNGGTYDTKYDIFKDKRYNVSSKSSKYEEWNVRVNGTINLNSVQHYLEDMRELIDETFNVWNDNLGSKAYNELMTMFNDLMSLYASGQKGYYLRNLKKYDSPEAKEYYDKLKNKYYSNKDSEIINTLEPIYEFTGKTNPEKESISKLFEKYINRYREKAALENGTEYSKYSFTEMYEEEDYCGYVDTTDPKPVFRCSLEYSFNSDGSISVRLPANSISFDETLYNLDSIKVLKYFGAADGTQAGHIFFPDGSGMVLDYTDFYNPVVGSIESTALSADIYGADNSYSPEVDPSKIVGAYREQVSMPVFGVVGTESAGSVSKLYGVSNITNGYFAIVESGSSLAKIEMQTGAGNTASAFCTYSPYPSDKYDLSNTISVGGADYYTMVSDAKFNGSYVTRYVMLTDEVIGETISKDFGVGYYESSYSGMAAYYRDYLYDNGTLTALSEISDKLPLYIEALGSMNIMDKFLTFPVEKSIALTTFDNVATMYDELRNSSSVLKEEMEKYQALADKEPEGSAKKAEYQAIADGYKNYSDFVINNINFRLTGFGSGGLSSNYPTKLRWERACGGKRGFKKLLETANDISASGDTFGIYPDYDFMYLSYSSMFDGVSKKNDVSHMIDNRYASKQVYDSISRQYVSYFSLVVNPESLDRLYSKFIKKYSKYDVTGISVSTMGSDLNSNFDDDKSINRNDAQAYVETVLSRMVKQNNYQVMLDMGNAYTLRYATHLLNVSTDSSRVRYSSYSVPFVGMILHGAVNYAGKPLNYSGMPEYDLLRSIESGAALYFILCYQNESEMKNDAILNDYFGVSYSSWYKDVVLNYNKLNNAIGDLQDYLITDHRTVIGERVVDSDEEIANYKLLMNEIIAMMDGQLDIAIGRAYETLRESGEDGWLVKVDIDKTALMAQFESILKLDFDGSEVTSSTKLTKLVAEFEADLDALIAAYNTEYPGAAENSANRNYVVSFNELIYGVSDILLSEMLTVMESNIKAFIADAVEYVNSENEKAVLEERNELQLVLTIGRDAMLKAMADVCKMDIATLEEKEGVVYGGKADTFGNHVQNIIDKYESLYPDFEEKKDEDTGLLDKNSKKKYSITMSSIDTETLYLYTSKYSFLTDSKAFDENYIYTDYTSDRGNIVIVTYTKGNHQVKFLLNYNIYTVEVRIGDETYKLSKYDYIRIEG